MIETRLPASVELVYPGAGNTVEGLCPLAESIWAGFLSASNMLGVKPRIVELRTPNGALLGTAIQKDHNAIHLDPSERNNPTYFGQPTYLVIESPFNELKKGIVVVGKQAGVYVRPFGSVDDSVRFARIEAEETEKLGGDPKRIDDLLAYIELALETRIHQFGRTPSPDELFEHTLAWAIKDR